ncbi:MAG: tetratricopeptide repeat protein [Alphaproteobacteria bacterium]|nr:tetratricopeptide repeat protein [Alphaproteobacteria bacterium]
MGLQLGSDHKADRHSRNWRRAAFGRVCALALVLPLLLAGCDGAEEREAAYFERGQALYNEGKLKKASLEFRNARQINPLNMEALYYLGLIREKEQKLRAAFVNFRKVVEQDPNHVGANVRVGRYYLLGGDIEKASKYTETVLKLDPENADAYALQGAVHIRRDRLDDARSAASKSLELDPKNVGAISVLVGVLKQEQKTDDAVAFLRKKVIDLPADLSLRLLLVELHRLRGEMDQIESVYSGIFEIEPNNLSYRIDLARFLISSSRLQDAEKVLRDGVAVAEDPQKARMLLVDFYANQLSADDAERAIKAMVAAEPENTELKFGLVQMYLKHRRLDGAEAALVQLSEKTASKPDAIRARSGLAQLRFAEGKVDSAWSLVRQVLKEDPHNGRTLITRAQLLLRDGKNADAIADLRQVLRDEPRNAIALDLIARAHLQSGEVELATDNLQQLLAVQPANDIARKRLIRLHAQRGNFEKALTLVEQALARFPHSEDFLLFKVNVLAAKKDLRRALETANFLRDIAKNKAMALTAVGRVYQAGGRHLDAVRAFTMALAEAPGAHEPLTGLTRSNLALRRAQDAIDFLNGVIAESPENVIAHNLLGEVYAFEKVAGKAESSFHKAKSIRRNWPRPYLNLSSLKLSQNKPGEAISLIKQGLEHAPKNISLKLGLAAAQQAAKDFEGALQTYEALYQRNPKLDAVANNIAALIADQKHQDAAQLDRALALAQRFQESDNPFYLDTLGWVQYRKGNHSLAVVFLKRAVDRLPTHAHINYHLGMALYKEGQKEEARRYLEAAVDGAPSFPEIEQARKLLATL